MITVRPHLLCLLLLCGLADLWGLVGSRAHAAESGQASDNAFVTAANAARRVTLLGPTDVTLADQASLRLPEGLDYIPEPEAGLLLQASGQSADATMLGLIQAHHSGLWLITVHFEALGYFPHGPDSPTWDSQALLAKLQADAERANVTRRQQGRTQTEVRDWLQSPALDTQSHRLAWGLALSSVTPDGRTPRELTSYSAHVLGRDGVLTLRMIGPASTHTFDKQRLHTILAGVQFLPGRHYEDFHADTDRIAQVPLDALVTGETQPPPPRANRTAAEELTPALIVNAPPTRWLIPSALVLCIVVTVIAIFALKRQARRWPSSHPTTSIMPPDRHG